MPPDVTILADDLSGAAEAASAFLGRDLATTLVLEPAAVQHSGVTVVDMNTRPMAAVDAERRLRATLATVPTDRLVLCKIDSLLRGHVGMTVDMLARRGPVVLAAGLPAQQRTIRGGVPHVAGTPLRETDLWRLEAGDPPRRLTDLFDHRAWDCLAPNAIPLAAAAGAVAVCDITTDADLDAVVRIALKIPGVQFVGTSALAAALARTRPAAPATVAPGRRAPVLVVAGTGAPIVAEQVAALRAGGAAHRALTATNLLTGRFDADVDAVAALLSRHPVTAVTVTGDVAPARSSEIACQIGRFVDAVQRRAGVDPDLTLTGGETARAVIDALGIHTVRPVDAVHHGAVVNEASDGRRIVTRPGSFGDRNSLVDIAIHLTSTQTSDISPTTSRTPL